MLDKTQKFLGAPDRISTIWFLLTIPLSHVILIVSFFPTPFWFEIIMWLIMLNGIFLLRYAHLIEKNTFIKLVFLSISLFLIDTLL